jgi:hypothetical protein
VHTIAGLLRWTNSLTPFFALRVAPPKEVFALALIASFCDSERFRGLADDSLAGIVAAVAYVDLRPHLQHEFLANAEFRS